MLFVSIGGKEKREEREQRIEERKQKKENRKKKKENRKSVLKICELAVNKTM